MTVRPTSSGHCSCASGSLPPVAGRPRWYSGTCHADQAAGAGRSAADPGGGDPAAAGADVLVDPEGRIARRYGARRGDVVLVRPDGYVGFVGSLTDTDAIARYRSAGRMCRTPAGSPATSVMHHLWSLPRRRPGSAEPRRAGAGRRVHGCCGQGRPTRRWWASPAAYSRRAPAASPSCASRLARTSSTTGPSVRPRATCAAICRSDQSRASCSRPAPSARMATVPEVSRLVKWSSMFLRAVPQGGRLLGDLRPGQRARQVAEHSAEVGQQRQPRVATAARQLGQAGRRQPQQGLVAGQAERRRAPRRWPRRVGSSASAEASRIAAKPASMCGRASSTRCAIVRAEPSASSANARSDGVARSTMPTARSIHQRPR